MPIKIENMENIRARVRFLEDVDVPTGWTRHAHVKVSFEDMNGCGHGFNHILDDFEVYSQMDDGQHDDPLHVYGEAVRFVHVYSLEEASARIMYDFLRKVNGELTRLYKRFGGCQTYGQFVVRVLDVLGVNEVVVESPMNHPEHLVRTDLIHYTDRPGLIFCIDHRCGEKLADWNGVRWSPDR
jgi:hypothetical protein